MSDYIALSKLNGDQELIVFVTIVYVRLQEFRRFFTLLPTSEYLLNYWVDASCFRGAVDVGSNFQGVGDNAVLLGAYKSSPLEKGSALSHLLAGGLAGALSRTFTAPLETIRLQMMITSSESMAEASREIIASCGGWTGFFKGNLTNVVRATPQKAIDFFSFEAYKKYLHRVGIRAPQLQMLTAGAMAGATSTTILYPLDVVRSRLTVQNCGQYKGILDALIKIPQQEGFFALYRGLGSSVIAIMPEAAICYGAFDILKRVYQNVTKKEEVELLPALACGATSAFLGQLVSFPLELVTRRMQTGAEYKNLVHALTSISSGGVCNLYKGIIPASLKVIPMAIVSFGTYEMGRSTLAKIAERERRRKMEKDALEDERRHRLVLVNLKADSGAAPRMHGS
ncbi:hypothetical protein CBR_g4760 [Chara braunii]|uniref:Mitochondrial carrier protein n=1 Tax=Chara braunii TaxID=69332 RepID=A0A388KIQ3_CHABU|nr:hypothetical protein CBR_g4760 [Chara braunii]|eukprot:GBG69935.1 hypothetical protein CBR_g4760 [Chara braunii]